ncbi:hypothetical protein D5085_10695 [Ectothiorhodospiraceae bacterium BW-2]|nr:hypothetical protein D5085_10695 [Ectothiorhodospiraceae bacterium BW-2]
MNALIKRGLGPVSQKIDKLNYNQGKMAIKSLLEMKSTNLTDYEFCVFSQFGEDGIIQKLISDIDIQHKRFIEFGVENFSESNCRYLMMNNNWSGFVIDGSESNINELMNAEYFWKYDLQACASFITKENINTLLDKSGFDGSLGLLSIDIDGNDYWMLSELNEKWKPEILILEYNAVFGATRNITVPYDAGFIRSNAHYSNLYFGASLGALTKLAKKKGYSFIGTNSAGNNAFYVRDDVLQKTTIPEVTVEQGFTDSKFRESRDANGKLTFFRGSDRNKIIKKMVVINVDTGKEELL